MDYSNHAELSVALVGTLPQEVAREIDEVNTTCTHEEEQTTTCCDTLMDLALYFLLFLQFGAVFYVQGDAVSGLRWPIVNASICLFIVATHLYRNALAEIEVLSDAAMLLPEIIIVSSVGLVFFYQVLFAFLLLLTGILAMALTVVVINAYRLWNYDAVEEESSSKALTGYESIV